jgi:dihydrofolate reductase
MKLSLIVAQSKNRVIGNKNELPWRLPKDLQYFKRVTLGKPIIMGRKTYESIGRPLPGRVNIVISSNVSLVIAGVSVVSSLKQAIEAAKAACLEQGVDEMMVMGGAQVYQQALPLVDRLYITEVDAVIEGDAFFPEVDYSCYMQVEAEGHFADDNNPYNYQFVTYDRRS